ncbi:MAG: M3 family metallopeptidase [Bacteriovoracia bacterium]
MKKALTGLFFCLSLSAMASNTHNILLQPWTGPYDGVPPFDTVKIDDFKPAIESALQEARKEINAIADNQDAPTFANTIEAFETAGSVLNRVATIFYVWSSSMNSQAFQELEEEMSPKFAAFQDETYQNSKLFKRIDAVYNNCSSSCLTAEAKRLTWLHWTRFVSNGARLDDLQKRRVSEINQRLAVLQTQFSNNELGDEEDKFLLLDNQGDLSGLTQEQINAAAEEGERRGLKGKWVIANTRSSMEPFLTYSSRRDLREKAFRIWTSRGDNGDEHDNNKIVTEILKLRTERSKILGFQTYAHWHLMDAMAKDPKNAMDLMMKVWKPAVETVHREVADMQAIVDKEGGGFKIEPWDYRFYAEKVRKEKYDLDFDLVKPYLQLENIKKAMFWSAGKLFGFQFVEIKDVPVYHPDMTVYKVLAADNSFVGLWYFDPYARPGKRSGAWMNNYREQYVLHGKAYAPIVSNNSNFIKGRPGEPVLLSWDDAVTMFHEFGHALHGLNSKVTYASLSGTNTARDFVEFPSQINENYLLTPEVLKFLVNEKGEQLPKQLIDKIVQAKTFNSGFDTVEFLASAIVDMKLHLVSDRDVDPKLFERDVLTEIGMPKEIVMRHRIPHFGHLFADEGYAAGYYGYLWAQVLEYDAFEAFTETGDPYNPVIAKRYHDYVVSLGNTEDPAEMYRNFRGRDPNVNALLRARGFPVQ